MLYATHQGLRTWRLGQVGSNQFWSLLFVSFLCDVTCKRRIGKFRMLSQVELSTQLRRHSHICVCLLFPYNYNLRRKHFISFTLTFPLLTNKYSFKLYKILYYAHTCLSPAPSHKVLALKGSRTRFLQSYSHLWGRKPPRSTRLSLTQSTTDSAGVYPSESWPKPPLISIFLH